MHTLTLTRDVSDVLPIHKAQHVANAKIRLNNITWRMPHIEPETTELIKLRDIIVKKNVIPIAFSARQSESANVPQRVSNHEYKLSLSSGIEKPIWIIVGFQVDRCTTQFQNPSVILTFPEYTSICMGNVTQITILKAMIMELCTTCLIVLKGSIMGLIP